MHDIIVFLKMGFMCYMKVAGISFIVILIAVIIIFIISLIHSKFKK
jgi:hypothetical protein